MYGFSSAPPFVDLDATEYNMDEAWSERRYFSEARMAELRAEPPASPGAPPDPERVLVLAREALEASLALADRMEAA